MTERDDVLGFLRVFFEDIAHRSGQGEPFDGPKVHNELASRLCDSFFINSPDPTQDDQVRRIQERNMMLQQAYDNAMETIRRLNHGI